jgi:hypothetical protein
MRWQGYWGMEILIGIKAIRESIQIEEHQKLQRIKRFNERLAK